MMCFLYLQDTFQEVPSALQGFKCEPWHLDYYLHEYTESEEKTAALIEKHLTPAAVKIQRQFRLWRWRLEVVFNPHTRIGHLNLLVKSRCAVKDLEQYSCTRKWGSPSSAALCREGMTFLNIWPLCTYKQSPDCEECLATDVCDAKNSCTWCNDRNDACAHCCILFECNLWKWLGNAWYFNLIVAFACTASLTVAHQTA